MVLHAGARRDLRPHSARRTGCQVHSSDQDTQEVGGAQWGAGDPRRTLGLSDFAISALSEKAAFSLAMLHDKLSKIHGEREGTKVDLESWASRCKFKTGWELAQSTAQHRVGRFDV